MQGVQPVAATFRGPIPWPHACTLPARKNNRGERLMAKHIGYAVVGAGPLVERALLPAFARAGEETRLAAIVSADRGRAHTLAQEHHATGYHYDEFRQALQREDVQAVYVALPNSLHCDYAVEAARAGAHVVCERPMAVMADECRRMLRTSQTNRVKLMGRLPRASAPRVQEAARAGAARRHRRAQDIQRSEEHTSELQSHSDLVCRLLLEKKNK